MRKIMTNRIFKCIFKWVMVVALALVSIGNLSVVAEESRLETLSLAGGTDFGAPNPFLQDPRGPGTAKVKLIFDSLLDADEEGEIGWLAKEWKVEGNSYTFKIHEGVSFHDGEPLTTEDIAFSIDYYKEHTPANNVLGSDENFIIESYDVVDDYTIVMEVDQSKAKTLESLGAFLILPKHIWEKVEDPMAYNEEDAFIGSGPYKKGEYDGSNGSYEFIANEDYYGLKPVADRVLFVPVADELLAFESGEIDITNVPADNLDHFKKHEGVEILSKDNDLGAKLLFNFDQIEAIKDLEVRQALAKAIDQEAILDKVYRGQGEVAMSGYVPTSNWYHNPETGPYEYDPEAAKEVLADLGLELNVLTGNAGEDVSTIELVKADLEAVGVKVNIEAVEGKVRDERIFEEDYEAAIVSNGGWGRAPDYLRTTYSEKSRGSVRNPHGMGSAGYANDQITELAEKQLMETDKDARREIFLKLQEAIAEETPLILLGTRTPNVAYRTEGHTGWVKTYDYVQVEQNRLSYVKR